MFRFTRNSAHLVIDGVSYLYKRVRGAAEQDNNISTEVLLPNQLNESREDSVVFLGPVDLEGDDMNDSLIYVGTIKIEGNANKKDDDEIKEEDAVGAGSVLHPVVERKYKNLLSIIVAFGKDKHTECFSIWRIVHLHRFCINVAWCDQYKKHSSVFLRLFEKNYTNMGFLQICIRFCDILY